MISVRLKTLLASLVFFALFIPALAGAAPTVGTVRVSSGSFPDFTFQIPFGADKVLTLCESGTDGNLVCPGIAKYIQILYRWLVGFAAVLAVLAMTWGGVQWLLSGGESGKIQEARKVIGNALIGLLLALGSYTFLATIGKDYVNFKPLSIQAISEIELPLLPAADKVKIGAPLTAEEAHEVSAIASTEPVTLCAPIAGFRVVKKQAKTGKWGCEYSPINTSTNAECAAQEVISYDKKCDTSCRGQSVGINLYTWTGKNPVIKKDKNNTEYACCPCHYQMLGGTPGGEACGLKDQKCCNGGVSVETGNIKYWCYDQKTSCDARNKKCT